MEVFEGRKGKYKIINRSKQELLVEYLSGPWLGKKVTLSLATHNRIQENLKIEAKVQESESVEGLLDLWWDSYPTLYKRHWRGGISGQELLRTLEVSYPEESESID